MRSMTKLTFPQMHQNSGAGRAQRWLEASDVVPMFPTLVWKFQLKPELRQAMDAGILDSLAAIRRALPALSQGEAWQSEQNLHQLDALQDLVSCVEDAALSVLRFLRIGYDALEITGCWANVLAAGAAHRAHSHPNNFLSGAYYLRTGAGADTINFHDPRVQTAILRPPVTELSAENTDQVVVRVAIGTLLLFPAWLQHSVDANRSCEERISISFNVMFPEFTEHLSRPLW